MNGINKKCSAKYEELKPSKDLGKFGIMIVERIKEPDNERIIEHCYRSEAIEYLQHLKDTFYEWGCKCDSSGEYLLDGSIELLLTHRSPSLHDLKFRFIPEGKPFKMIRKFKTN